jgi:serine phosphatase RsbU (regulator of sigma subunit)
MAESMSGSASVLVIDDDKQVSDLIRNMLKNRYHVVCHPSAEEALKVEEMASLDVVITDINLPGINGIEMLKRVQGVDSGIPVILVTGFGDVDVAISALKSGAFDFILKPFTYDQIEVAVRKAVESRRLILENRVLLEELRVKNRELEQLNRSIQSRNIAIEHELDIASDLQKCIFPIALPHVENCEFFLKFKPVEKISGDFFDFNTLGEQLFSLTFADVSGHGVPAALYSAMVKTAITSMGEKNPSPADFVQMINRFLIGAQKKMSYNYVTLFYGLIDLGRGTLTYSNAGIPSPVIIRDGCDLILLEPNGPFVGIFESSQFRTGQVEIKRGDKIILYTDGIFECTNRDDKILGQKILLDILKKLRDKDMGEILESLLSEVIAFCGREDHKDDITLLGMYYKP